MTSKNNFKQTERREYGKSRDVLRAIYGFNQIGEQKPYFSITGKGWRFDGTSSVAGCCHDEIKEAFPELAPLIRWHLVDNTGVPMHYIDNGMYWHQNKNWDNMASTIVLGAAPDDHEWFEVIKKEAGWAEKWLKDRLPYLLGAMTAEMVKYGISLIL